jgi:hypothetical protein
MQVEPSSVADVELIVPGTREFKEAIELLLGREPDDVLKPALPYSVIVRNSHSLAVALLGVRFDMVGRKAKPYSVIHYADTLRYPEKANLAPGTMRFVCAEPLYTDLVLRRASQIDRRGPMNLSNLRQVLRIRASLDCAAFDDGQFAGPDSLGAFDRFDSEREAEIVLLEQVLEEALKPDCRIEGLLEQAMEVPRAETRDWALTARRTLAKRLHEGLTEGGLAEVATRVRNHRLRIRLWREEGARHGDMR